MPIIDPSGFVARSFPDGVGLNDPAKVRAVIREQALTIGLGEEIDSLLEKSIVERFEGDPLAPYPFEYVQFDAVVEEALTPEIIRDKSAEIVDLASLLTKASDYDSGSMSFGGALAYSLLNRTRAISNTCQVQLNLAFIVSIARRPDNDAIEKEFSQAIDMCPGDPSPLWWLGQSRLVRAIAASGTTASHSDLIASADEPFESLRNEHPGPLGWAGGADLRLELAATLERARERPFEARLLRLEAVELYREARRTSVHPGLLAGQARALSDLGRHDEAINLMSQLPRQARAEVVYQVLNARILRAAHRHGDAAAAIGDDPDSQVPQGFSLVPSVVGSEAVDPPELRPFRFGLSDAKPVAVLDANGAGPGAGGFTFDWGWLLVHRGDYNGYFTSGGWCRDSAYLVDLVLSGQSRRALEFDRRRSVVDPSATNRIVDDPICNQDPKPVGPLAAAELGERQERDRMLAASLEKDHLPAEQLESQVSDLYDLRQDLWRWAGNLAKAEAVAKEWISERSDDRLAVQRLAEIRFLRGGYEDSVDLLEPIVRSLRQSDFQYLYEDDGVAAAQLLLGTSLELTHQTVRARRTYMRMLELIPRTDRSNDELNAVKARTHAYSQLGTLSLRLGNYKRARDELTASIREASKSSFGADPFLHGAQENNLSLAYTKLGNPTKAIAAGKAALTRDPANPVFIDTLAFAQTFGPNPDDAVSTYRRAVREDPGLFPSWNNMAVLLAKDGQLAEAVEALRQAIKVKPRYSLAWKNLGVVLREAEPLDILSSQGAFARAGQYDRSLRGKDAELEFDMRIYDSGLDVSKPVTADWTFSTAAREPVNLFTKTMVALLAIRVFWTLGLDKVGGQLTTRFIQTIPISGRRWRGVWARAPAAWAAGIAIAVLTVPVAQSGARAPELLTFVLGSFTLALLPIAIRHAYSVRLHKQIRHFSWPPGLVVGVLAAPFLSFAPPPCLDDKLPAVAKVRWAGPISLAIVSVCFLVLAAAIPAPVVRNLAMASVTILGSALIPVEPFDGAAITRKSLDLAITIALTLVTVAFHLKWI